MTERNIIPRVREQLEELGYSRNSIVEQFEFSPGILADLAVLNENGKPRIIAEIKTTIHLPLGRNQLERYLKKSRADYGLLTDGNVGYYYARLGSDEIIEITRLPRNGEALNSISKTPLKPLTDFSYKFWKIFDVLRGELPLDVQFKEFLKIILCKYVDELDDRNAPTFVVSDPSLSGWQETTKNRIETLFENTKQRYPDLFRATEKLELSARAISYIVGEMQNYCVACDPAALSFAMTELQKRIVRSAENSTPAQLVKLVIEMLTPNENDTVLDLACGYGNFLSGLLHYTMERQPPDSQLASSLASNIFGIEINSNVALFAKANMILYGVGGENILVGDALSELPYSPRLHEILKQGGFDLVFVDPPLLGRTTPNKYAMDYHLAMGRSNIEVWFLERAILLARYGGRIAMVVPERFLFADHLKRARDFIQEKTRVLAIIRLPIGILMPYSGAKVSLLILQKNDPKHEYSDYKLLMAEPETDESLSKVPNCFHNEKLNPPWVLRLTPSKLGPRWNVEYHLAGPAPTHGEPLTEFAEIKRGVSVPSNLYGTRSKDTIVFIRISDLFEGTVSSTFIKHIPRQKARADATVKTNDVLFSVAGTLGKTAVVPRNLAGALVSSQIAILRPKKLVKPEYLSLALSSKSVKEQIKRFETGALIKHVSVRELKNIRLLIPSLQKQREALRKLKRLRNQYRHSTATLQQVQQEIEKLKEGA